MQQSEARRIVTELVRDRTVRRSYPIISGTSLYPDLRIYGDDAYEILVEMHQKFGTDFSEFAFAQYFPLEGGLGPWFQRLCGKSWKPLTVGHLAAVLESGRWFEPNI
jgi:hypothetical protein